MVELNIVYDCPSVHYYTPGSTVRGHIDANNPTQNNIEVLQFVSRCMGRAITSWTENRPPQETLCTEVLKYFKRTAAPEPPIRTLAPGITHVGFAFLVPEDFKPMPLANFKSKFGNIEFFVEAEVEYVTKKTRLTKLRATEKVVRRFRMKPDEVAMPNPVPAIRSKEWPVGLFFFGRPGSVKMEFSIPTTSFLPGQPLNYQMEIKNCTRRKIVSVTLKLKQIITYKAQSFVKVRKEVPLIVKIVDYPACIPPTDTQHFSGEGVILPADLPPSGLGACPIIDLVYVLQVVVLVFGFHKSKENIPLTICTIPGGSDGVVGRRQSEIKTERVAGPSAAALSAQRRAMLDKMESIDIGAQDTKYQPIDSD